ncbi:MAG: hypothetical protein NZ455_02635 [Bacteroidia bacterium]|nr:hypothetical protein [Bacteroidia bacterium]MDW8347304.1 hypothetical protein [Bacteroidia bacterium]
MDVSLWALRCAYAHKDTPKKVKLFFRLNVILYDFLCEGYYKQTEFFVINKIYPFRCFTIAHT